MARPELRPGGHGPPGAPPSGLRSSRGSAWTRLGRSSWTRWPPRPGALRRRLVPPGGSRVVPERSLPGRQVRGRPPTRLGSVGTRSPRISSASGVAIGAALIVMSLPSLVINFGSGLVLGIVRVELDPDIVQLMSIVPSILGGVVNLLMQAYIMGRRRRGRSANGAWRDHYGG